MKLTQDQINEARKHLTEILKPSDQIYCSLVSVSSSGMSRKIKLLIARNNKIINLSWWAARAMERKFDDKSDSIKVNGYGMDMGFELVYSLACTLWPNGDGKTVTGRNGDTTPETDGGYLLKHSWL
jgi:hypothetical protein